MEIPTAVRDLHSLIEHKNLDYLKPNKLIDTLHRIAADQQIKPDWRASARKTSALLKNIIRTKGKITIFDMLLVLQSTPFGSDISSRIIFYATIAKFHENIPSHHQQSGVIGQYLRATQP